MLSAVASAMGKSAPVGFRVNPDVTAGGHAKITDRVRRQQVRHRDR